MPELRDTIQQHYGRAGLGDAILAALAAAGKDPDRLTPEDLAPIDEFHVRGREATAELAQKAGLGAGTRVLDVGSGIGGPSRHLAAAFGCRVTGLDLTAEYCAVASMLTERVGLAGLVAYRQGNALDMPFADGAFDVVWTQHAAMNIPDKARLYAECRRVLRQGGVLALYDILAGAGGPPHYPAPWAREPAISFLVTPEELRGLLEEAGFEILSWCDRTAAGREWFSQLVRRIREQGPPPLGVHVLVGADFPAMADNQRRNLEEDRIALVEVVGRAT